MIKKITRDELIKMASSGQRMKIIDVLSKESYAKEHIKGAISLPLETIDKDTTKQWDKKETIVVYCASFDCPASTKAAEKLQLLGFKNVLDYKGGLKDYKEGSLPLEGGQEEEVVSGSSCGCD